MQRVSAAGTSFYRNDGWGDLRHGIFTRHGGVSQACWNSLNLGASIGDDPEAVRENHRRMYRALDVNAGRAVSSWLVHSVTVKIVDDQSKLNGNLERADAIVTNQPDTPLVMRFADCVPLLLYDPGTRVIGLAHAGWRGTVKGMAGAAVRALESAFACRPQDVQALIGPAISRRNYQVGDEVAAQARAYFGEDAGVVSVMRTTAARTWISGAPIAWTWSGRASVTSRYWTSAPMKIRTNSTLIAPRTGRRAASAW